MSDTQVPGRDDPLDCVVRFVTPERIVVAYPIAGPSRRFIAYVIDQLLLITLMLTAVLLSLVLSMGSPAGMGPALVAWFALTWGYGGFCEGVFNGQTLGKRLMRLRVVSDRGVPITGAQAILRNLVGTVDGILPFFFQIGLASMILSRRFQRLGDLAAGTIVLVEERRWRRGFKRIKNPEVDALLPWLPSRISVGSDVARVLSDYAEARERFGPLRRAEMAEPLARPLRQRYGLSEKASADSVLCALYHRVFVGE
jgi:uncharacterized RDD family membrane protein YckC